jgi:hypothetical protein
MKLFTKNNGMTKLFSKDGGKTLFQKIGDHARKVDNTVTRVGNFLSSSARTLGFNPIGDIIDRGVKTVHNIRNNLEKSIKAPLNDIRQHYA